MPALATPASPTPSDDAMRSILESVDGFRTATARFEKLSGSTPPRGVSELVYNDAYLQALAMSRRQEVRGRGGRGGSCLVDEVCRDKSQEWGAS